MITAGFALEQNREVFAVPDRIYSIQSYGSHHLISQNKAKLIQNAQDILEEFSAKPVFNKKSLEQQTLAFPSQNLDSSNETTSKQQIPVETLTKAQHAILKILHQTPSTFDDLCETTQISIPILSSSLTELELQGFIILLENQHYEVSYGMYYASE